MGDKKEYMEKIYELFSEEMKPTEEMKKVYDEFSERILSLKEKLPKDQLEELKVVEDLFSEIASLEVKQAFIKGFSVATKIGEENRN